MPGLEISFDLPEGWEKSQASNEIPYYLNHNTEVTQWEHPAITKIFAEFAYTLYPIESFDNVKYSAYRTSMKIRLIQSLTNIHLVKVKNITDASEAPNIMNSRTLSVSEVELLLAKIFSDTTISKRELSIELTLNILLKCLDGGRTGIMNSLAVFVVLLTLCSGTPAMKFKAIFNITCHQEGLSKVDMNFILESMLSITECINEGEYFGINSIPPTINSCCQFKNSDWLVEKEFLQWVSDEPQVLVWLPTLNRIVVAESVKHEAKCVICKEFPIVGLRFRCLKCFNTDICQNCFLTKKSNRTHKFSHPTKEYCLATTSTDDFKDLIKQVKNKVTRGYRHVAQTDTTYLYPIESQQKSSICNLNEVHKQIESLAIRLNSSPSAMENELVEVKVTQESIEIQTSSHLPWHRVLQTSTSELLDKGVSASTMDDFSYIGEEDETLNRMTKRILSIFDTNVNANDHTQSLLVLSSEVSTKVVQFVNSLKQQSS